MVRLAQARSLQFCFRLLQPDLHVHLAVHRRRGGEVLLRLLALARAPVELAEANYDFSKRPPVDHTYSLRFTSRGSRSCMTARASRTTDSTTSAAVGRLLMRPTLCPATNGNASR